MIYEIKIRKIINPISYKGKGRPKKKDYLNDLSELIEIYKPIKIKKVRL